MIYYSRFSSTIVAGLEEEVDSPPINHLKSLYGIPEHFEEEAKELTEVDKPEETGVDKLGELELTSQKKKLKHKHQL